MDAIIGYTGFVGSHLIRKHDFDAQLNTSNISDAFGQSYSTVVCAAAPGSMFEANNFPDRDKYKVDTLIRQLSQIRADRFILVSSIAVLANFSGKDIEDTKNFQTELPYGRHRRELEVFCEDNFESCLILRLPALFGHKLKKNFIFDILNPVPSMLNKKSYDELIKLLSSNLAKVFLDIYSWDDKIKMFQVDRTKLQYSGKKEKLDAEISEAGYPSIQFTNPKSTYQYYNIERLWSDIKIANKNNINVLHLATEPMNAAQIHLELTGKAMPDTRGRIHQEDMHSKHSALWGENGPYLIRSTNTLGELKQFYQSEIEKA